MTSYLAQCVGGRRTDVGNSTSGGTEGSRVFFPGYSIGEWTAEPVATDRFHTAYHDALTINWGIWREHSSTPSDICESEY